MKNVLLNLKVLWSCFSSLTLSVCPSILPSTHQIGTEQHLKIPLLLGWHLRCQLARQQGALRTGYVCVCETWDPEENPLFVASTLFPFWIQGSALSQWPLLGLTQLAAFLSIALAATTIKKKNPHVRQEFWCCLNYYQSIKWLELGPKSCCISTDRLVSGYPIMLCVTCGDASKTSQCELHITKALVKSKPPVKCKNLMKLPCAICVFMLYVV